MLGIGVDDALERRVSQRQEREEDRQMAEQQPIINLEWMDEEVRQLSHRADRGAAAH